MMRAATATILVFLPAILWAAGRGDWRATEIDRVLAAVNGKIITAGDLRVMKDLNAVLQFGRERPGETGSEADEIQRLVDRELVRQELEAFPLGAGDRAEVENRMAELTEGFVEIGGLAPLLERLGLREEELRSYLRLQASILRFVDLRFRPFATASPAEIESYYNEQLVPKLRRGQAPVPPVAEVRDQIERILLEEKVNDAMEKWIDDLRRNARIEKLADGVQNHARVKP